MCPVIPETPDAYSVNNRASMIGPKGTQGNSELKLEEVTYVPKRL